MSTLTKSPVFVAREALAVASQSLRRYAHKFSPQRFTQPQLFACLALKTFFKTDYRGICVLLTDLPQLRATLGLRRVPHFTTLHKASKRLLRLPRTRRLLNGTLQRRLKRRRRVQRAAFDSTGLDCGQRSIYYVRRRAATSKQWQRVAYSRYAKLELSVDTQTHLILAARMGRGPRVDTDCFVPLLEATLDQVRVSTVLADAGYDSEPNHQHARDVRGVRSFMPAKIGRPSPKPPTGKYRRRMRQRLNKDYGCYGQRWQVESTNSMLQRRLATAVQARRFWAECRELWLLVLTYNLMLQITK
jgi:hypothetical protein